MGPGDLRLLVAANGADDGGAEMARPLVEDQADAAGSGMEQNGLACFAR